MEDRTIPAPRPNANNRGTTAFDSWLSSYQEKLTVISTDAINLGAARDSTAREASDVPVAKPASPQSPRY